MTSLLLINDRPLIGLLIGSYPIMLSNAWLVVTRRGLSARPSCTLKENEIVRRL